MNKLSRQDLEEAFNPNLNIFGDRSEGLKAIRFDWEAKGEEFNIRIQDKGTLRIKGDELRLLAWYMQLVQPLSHEEFVARRKGPPGFATPHPDEHNGGR